MGSLRLREFLALAWLSTLASCLPTYLDPVPVTFNVHKGGFDVNFTVSAAEVLREFPNATSVTATVACNLLPINLKTITSIAPFMNATVDTFWSAAPPITTLKVVVPVPLSPAVAQGTLHARELKDSIWITKCAVKFAVQEFGSTELVFGRPTIAIEPAVFAADPLSDSETPGVVACHDVIQVLGDEGEWMSNTSYPWAQLAAASGKPGTTDGGDFFKCEGIPDATFCTNVVKMVSWTGYCLPRVCNAQNVAVAFSHYRSRSLVRQANPELVLFQTFVDRQVIEQQIVALLNLTGTEATAFENVMTGVLLGTMARLGPALQSTLTAQEIESIGAWSCGSHHTTPSRAMWLWFGVVAAIIIFAIACTFIDHHYTTTNNNTEPRSYRMFRWPSFQSRASNAQTGNGLARTLLEPASPASSMMTDTDAPNVPSSSLKVADWPTTWRGEVVKMWSLKRNWEELVSVREGPLQFFDGIRVLSAGWVVLGHTEIYALMTTFVGNPQVVFPFHDHPEDTSLFWYQIIPGGFFAVDTFLWIGGFFATFIMLRKARRVPLRAFVLSLPLLYVNRYLRLLPSIALILGAFWFLLPNMGSGPFWITGDSNKIDGCDQSWWAEILFLVGWSPDWLNCLGVTWYISCDLFYFLLTPWIVMVYLRHYVIAIVIIVACMCATSAHYYVLSHHYRLSSSTLENSGPGFNRTYYHPFTRANPYLIGILFGMFFDYVWLQADKAAKRRAEDEKAHLNYSNNNNNNDSNNKQHDVVVVKPKAGSAGKPNECGDLKLSFGLSLLLQSLGVLIVSLCVFGLYDALKALKCTRYNPQCVDTGYRWSQNVSDFYNVFSRLGFSVGLTLLSVVWIWGESWAPISRWILSRPIMSPLGKLAFMIYLWHTFFIRWFYGVQPTPIYYARLNILIWWLGFFGSALAMATLSYLFVEAPFANMQTRCMGILEARLSGKRRK